MFHVPEKWRITDQRNKMFGTTKYDGNEGCFKIDHPKIAGYWFTVVASDGKKLKALPGNEAFPLWEHVSVSLGTHKRPVDRCPTWGEMCFIKELFWDDEDCVVQYHPPKSEYVSMHDHCLHLWRSVEEVTPQPPSITVGVNPENQNV